MDLSALSDADLMALKAGDITKVSDQGLTHLKSQASQPLEQPGGITSAAGGIGKGVGDVALGAQSLLGKGLRSVGGVFSTPNLSGLITGQSSNPLVRAGNWLVNDAATGKANLAQELQPYKDAHPYAAGGGELAGNVLATLPVGGLLGVGAKSLGASAPVVNALTSAGMRTGSPLGSVGGNALAAGAARVSDLAIRALGGATTGGASAALVNPEDAGIGALVGGALPPAVKGAAALGGITSDALSSAAERLMQSAIKPTIEQLKDGSAATAVKTLLEYGISPTKSGVEKLRQLIGDKNAQIADEIANSGASVDKQTVLNSLAGVRNKFSNQVSPTSDLNAIQRVADDFAAHPQIQGNTIPVQDAQAMKQGTYKVLAGKYGETGSADTEAQKALARGLKEEIATAVPAVGPLNAEESKLISTLGVAERRALMELNKNPMGLAALAHNPLSWAAFMADRSSAFKAMAARMVNATANAPGQTLLSSPALESLLGRAPLLATSGQQ